MPSAEEFDLANQPPEKRPDLMVAGIGGDALHLDTALRIFLRTGAKPLNFFQYRTRPSTSSWTRRSPSRPTTKTNQVYLEVTEIIKDDACGCRCAARPTTSLPTRASTVWCENSYIPYIFVPNAIKKV